MYRIDYTCLSHIGKRRSSNQDNYICAGRILESGESGLFTSLDGTVTSRDLPLFGVFDGMGGEYGGDQAARIAAETARDFTPRAHHILELLSLCQQANDAICAHVHRNGLPLMGTTAAMLLFHRRGITLCNIGDSRIFSLSDGILRQISTDHVCDTGAPGKAPLSQNLGIPRDEFLIEPYAAELPYRDGSLYLICSDGLTDMVCAETIEATLTHTPFRQAAESLLQQALRAGGRDNVTILLLRTEKVRTLFGLRTSH